MPDVGGAIGGTIGAIGSIFGGGGDDQAAAYQQAGAAQAAAAKYAADMQYKAAKESNELIERMYQTGRTDLAPWRMTGQVALDVYSGLLGLPSIYTTQLPSLTGQNVLAAGLPGTAGTPGIPGTPGTPAGTFDYSTLGYQMTPGGTLQPLYQGDAATKLNITQRYGEPKLVGMYGETPIYDVGGKLFYAQGGRGLAEPFNQSIATYNQQLDRFNKLTEAEKKGLTAPTYAGVRNSFGYLPDYGNRVAGGMPSLMPYQGSAQGTTWIPGYTPPIPGTPGTAGTAGTGGAATNALAPYDISSPSNRIDPTAWVKQTPGYQFQFQEGLNALDRTAASRGMLMSGAQQRAATEYGQNYALGHYDNLMNRLAALSGIGQTSSTSTGSMGMNAANMQSQNAMMAAQNAGMARMAGAQAIGSGYVNAANVNAANQNAMWRNLGSLGGAVGGAIGNIFGGSSGGGGWLPAGTSQWSDYW